MSCHRSFINQQKWKQHTKNYPLMHASPLLVQKQKPHSASSWRSSRRGQSKEWNHVVNGSSYGSSNGNFNRRDRNSDPNSWRIWCRQVSRTWRRRRGKWKPRMSWRHHSPNLIDQVVNCTRRHAWERPVKVARYTIVGNRPLNTQYPKPSSIMWYKLWLHTNEIKINLKIYIKNSLLMLPVWLT